MGLRFRKCVSIVPGIRVNLSRKGISVSLGTKGVTANLSKDGIRNTVSIPGSGLSYSRYQKYPQKANDKDIRPLALYAVLFVVAVIVLCVAIIIATVHN